MDEIRIENLKIFANHGVYEQEKSEGQDFYVNAVLYADTFAAGRADDLSLSTDYGEVCALIERIMTAQSFDLIEAAAEAVAEGILHGFDMVESVDVEVRKPHAPIPLPFESVSVKIHRGWQTAAISLGSNLGDSRALIEAAVQSFRDSKDFRNIRTSELIRTAPYGYTDQPDFLNGAIVAETLLTAQALLDFMSECERAANRKRELHWGPRTLDLDLIFYGSEVISTERLTVPHPDMQNRGFVLRPLAEIAPYMRHPIFGQTVNQLLAQLEEGGND